MRAWLYFRDLKILKKFSMLFHQSSPDINGTRNIQMIHVSIE